MTIRKTANNLWLTAIDWFAVSTAILAVLCPRCTGSQILLKDVTKGTGITFRHTDGSNGQRYVVETVTAGLALFDYDDDGDVDIYFLNGAPLKGTKVNTVPKNNLYRNDGDWKFTDVTEQAGVGNTGYALGVTTGDYDNDGDLDLYLNNYGPNILYRNNGDGTFTNVTEKAGVECGSQMGAGTCFLDMDADGDLDLYVSNYLEFSYDKHYTTMANGIPIYVGPPFYPPTPDVIYSNNGDGTFKDVSKTSGIAQHLSWGMGTVCGDYDSDGDTDILVANDSGPNLLFQNDGTGKFEEVGLLAGVACDMHGDNHGSMGAEFGDYDNDGRFDFYVTSYQRQLATLYRNLGDGLFEDATRSTGGGAGTLPHVTWGANFIDFDNDGDRDIFVACGHLHDNIEQFDDRSTYFAKNILLMNTGDGKFADVSETSGDGMNVCLSSRGAGFDDLDNDGDIDVVILNSRREPTILRNESASKGHWLQILLRGTKTNRDGVGAYVKVVAGNLTQIDEVHSGRGYQSHYGMRLHFGLGEHNHIDRIEVRWIGGKVDIFEKITADQLVILAEGSSRITTIKPK